MPSRAAVSRSITSVACRPRFCWSLLTSASTGDLPQSCRSNRRPVVQLVEIVALQRVLILRIARSAADADILRRPAGTASRPGISAELAAAAARSPASALHLALRERLQRDEHAGRVPPVPPPPVNADDAVDRRIGLDACRRSRVSIAASPETTCPGRPGWSPTAAGVLLREEALGNDDVEIDVQRRP